MTVDESLALYGVAYILDGEVLDPRFVVVYLDDQGRPTHLETECSPNCPSP